MSSVKSVTQLSQSFRSAISMARSHIILVISTVKSVIKRVWPINTIKSVMSMVKSVIKMVWSVIRRVELSQPTISKTGQTDISSCSSGQSFISRVSSVSHLGRPAFNRVRSVSVGQSQC